MKRILLFAIATLLLFSGRAPAQFLGVVGEDIAVKGIWYDVRLDGATGAGVVDDHEEIEAADAEAASAGSWLFMPPGLFRISDSMEFTSNVWFAEGAILSIDVGDTVTFGANSKLEAGLYQIFSGAGSVSFNRGSLLETVYPQWWGATGDGVTDDTAAIQAAVTAAQHITYTRLVFFPFGRYRISSAIDITRRVRIQGVGIGSQIFQESDEHVFDVDDDAVGVLIDNTSIQDLWLASAATSAGKALIYLHYCDSVVIRNVGMWGSYYGIYVHGSIFGHFENLYSYENNLMLGWGEYGATNQAWVYVSEDGSAHSNANLFLNNILSYGVWGYHFDTTGAEDYNHIIGGSCDNGTNRGVWLVNTRKLAIRDLHMESAYASPGITLDSCRVVSIENTNVGALVINNSQQVNVENCNLTAVSIDRFSEEVEIVRSTYDSMTADAAKMDISSMYLNSGEYFKIWGRQNRAGRNLVDGDLEIWSGGNPADFARDGTGNLVVEETTIVKFGSSSAKIQTGAAGGHVDAYIYTNLDIARQAKTGLTNYRSSAYQWTLSASGTAEYYCEISGGGDPGIDESPKIIPLEETGGVLINDTWEEDGTLGSLAQSKWGYGDNDSLGYSTVYVRLSDDTDPDSKAAGYVRAQHKFNNITITAWVYKPETNGANPRIELVGSNIVYPGGLVSVPFDEWTRVGFTFPVFSGANSYIRPLFGFRAGSPNSICYIDAIEIVEGGTASPIYDDSSGYNGNFRVSGTFTGNIMTASSLAVDTITANTGSSVTFNGTGELIVDYETIYTPSAAQLIDAVGDSFVANAGAILLNPHAGNWTLTSTPHCPDGTYGQEVRVFISPTELSRVTLQDEDTLPGSNLQLGAATRDLDAHDIMVLFFDGTYWREVSYQQN